VVGQGQGVQIVHERALDEPAGKAEVDEEPAERGEDGEHPEEAGPQQTSQRRRAGAIAPAWIDPAGDGDAGDQRREQEHGPDGCAEGSTDQGAHEERADARGPSAQGRGPRAEPQRHPEIVSARNSREVVRKDGMRPASAAVHAPTRRE
jgi:hypothetical protein